MNVAVGFHRFSPTVRGEAVPTVAERRLNAGVLSNPSGVAMRRQIAWAIVNRGLKPAATLTVSLRETAVSARTWLSQTLTRGPPNRPRARSVWTASDLSALPVRRETASG